MKDLPAYKQWFTALKARIKQSQIKAAISVNTEMIMLYWDLGRQIVDKQQNAKWGSGFIEQLSKDLKEEFPNISGFSRSNLFAMKKFYLFHNQNDTKVQQLVGQFENKLLLHPNEIFQQTVGQIPHNIRFCSLIPWSHNILIIEKAKNYDEAFFYIQETIVNNWSRSVLEYQIESNLYKRQGKSVNNFALTLPKAESDLAQQLLKDPYNFEFLTIEKQVKEAELEKQLVAHITQFLLELGKGFAYLGRQFPIKVGTKEYRTDLLFYHIHLRAYIIIELKTKEFEPEFIGKLGFYITAINELIKTPHDNPTIGILLCKEKDNYEVEFTLRDVNKPIGVSAYTYKELPEEIKKALPDMDALKNELNKLENEE
ncbi:MAG: hypothetical protein BWY70_00406 [Bacteroidetes bacterium ADurb.Bin408]|nr:MAG: hypothetical protein BWY70_00406 [Bacteroidetes bacterium ADurb.Bin408]